MERSPCTIYTGEGRKMSRLTYKEVIEVSVEDLDLCFTGSRDGITQHQDNVLRYFIRSRPARVRHGDCKGADTRFHQLCLAFGYDETNLDIHPGPSLKWRAFNNGGTLHKVRPNMIRNRLMVMLSEVVVACPKTSRMDKRSGTWRTIAYAQSRAILTYIIFPSGKVEVRK